MTTNHSGQQLPDYCVQNITENIKRNIKQKKDWNIVFGVLFIFTFATKSKRQV